MSEQLGPAREVVFDALREEIDLALQKLRACGYRCDLTWMHFAVEGKRHSGIDVRIDIEHERPDFIEAAQLAKERGA